MTMFVPVAALLLIAALLFVLPVLLRAPGPAAAAARHSNALNLEILRDQLRELDADLANGTTDQDGYDAARRELEMRVASDVLAAAPLPAQAADSPVVALLIGLCVPAVALSLYFFLGNPNGLDAARVQAGSDLSANITPEQIAKMVAGLEQRLKNNPADAQGWEMLARSYHVQGRFRDSAQAYAQLVTLIPGNADLLADYADVLGMAQNRSLQGEPENIIARALRADPDNIKALALAGSAAFDRQDYQDAIARWKKILARVDPQSDVARAIANSISQAQTLSGRAPAAGPAAPSAAADSGSVLEGQVELDTRLQNLVGGDATVFVYARAAQGPLFPLAVLKRRVRDLPLHFRLDDSMGVMPNVKMSDFAALVVGARISVTGNATPQPGDLEGLSAPVSGAARGLKIVINTRRR